MVRTQGTRGGHRGHGSRQNSGAPCGMHPAGCAGARRERRTAEGATGQEERGHGGDTAGDRHGAAQGCQAVQRGGCIYPGLG